MGKIRRIWNFIKNLMVVAIGIIVLLMPIDSARFTISLIFGCYISLAALSNIFYYLTSARHMIGGGKILLNGIIELDIGLFSFFVILSSPEIAMGFFIFIFMFLGIVRIIRAFEIKKNEGKGWFIKLLRGLIAINFGIVCIVFIKDAEILQTVFGAYWIVEGIEGIVFSFKRGAVVYIEDESILNSQL